MIVVKHRRSLEAEKEVAVLFCCVAPQKQASLVDMWWIFVIIVILLLIAIILVFCCICYQTSTGETYKGLHPSLNTIIMSI